MTREAASSDNFRAPKTVKELVDRLGEMKNSRLSPRDRLEFLLDNPVVKSQEVFSHELAFEVDARSRCRRLEDLEHIQRTLRELGNAWSAGPLEEDVRRGGTQLLGYLGDWLEDALRVERRHEIEMLEQLWESAPNVEEHFFPGRKSGDAPVENVVPPEVREVLEEHRKNQEEIVRENLANVDGFDDKGDEKTGASGKSALEEYREALEKHVVDLDEMPRDAESLEREALEAHTKVLEKFARDLPEPRPAGVSVMPMAQSPSASRIGDIVKVRDRARETAREPGLRLDPLTVQRWTNCIEETLPGRDWAYERQEFIPELEGARVVWFCSMGKLTLEVRELEGTDEVEVSLAPSSREPLDEKSRGHRFHSLSTVSRRMSRKKLDEMNSDPSEMLSTLLPR